jgi:hypothetical protein
VTVTYKFRACNTGQTYLDLTITGNQAGSSTPPVPPGGAWSLPPDGGPWVFPAVPPGECREVTYTVQITPEMAPEQGCTTWKDVIAVTANLSTQTPCAACAVPPSETPSTCEAAVTVCAKPRELNQAYPGNSLGLSRWQLGYKGSGDDTISSVPGVFQIIPGDAWANFVRAARDGVPYTIKNVVLKKETPPVVQCADVFPPKTIMQQGTPKIRLWWPLMYEIPGTRWTLTIVYGTSILYDDDGPSGPNPPAYVHTEIWGAGPTPERQWVVDASIESMKLLLELFHELPFGQDEVPLVSDEVLYPILQQKLSQIKAYLDAGDKLNAGLLLGEFEMEVADACISVSPAYPNVTGPGTGIANTLENPACCKLLVDAEWVGKKEKIWNPNAGPNQ